MHENVPESPEEQLETSLDEGILGDEYEVIGVYNEEDTDDSGFDYEIFIVSVGSVI